MTDSTATVVSKLSDLPGMALVLWDGDRSQRKAWLLAREKEGRLAECVGRVLTEFLAEFVQGETGALNRYRYLHHNSEKDLANVLDLLEIIRKDLMPYKLGRVTEFLAWGSIAVPMLPVGLEFLRVAKDFARDVMRSKTERFVDEGSTLGKLLEAILKGSANSGILGQWTNTTKGDDQKNTGLVRLGVDLDPGTIKALPLGSVLPPSLLSKGLEGVEIDNLENLRTGADMCMDGTIEFLDRFGISFEGGMTECDSCGSETDHDCDEISYCETFTLTAPMVEAIDRAGFLEKVTEHLECDGAGADWTEFLEEHDTAAEQLEALTPPAKYLEKDSIKYNPIEWRFTPDYSGLESIDLLDTDELLELLPVLVEVARIYEGASALPPIPGKLERAEGTCSYRRRGDGSLSWDPQEGTLTHATNSQGAVLTFDATLEGGAPRLSMPGKPFKSVRVHPFGNVFSLDVLPSDVGPLAVRYLPIAQGKAEV